MSSPSTSENRPNAQAHGELYDAGMVLRRKVMVRTRRVHYRKLGLMISHIKGDEYVDNQLQKVSCVESSNYRSFVDSAHIGSVRLYETDATSA